MSGHNANPIFFTVCGENTEKRLESQVKLHRIIVNSS